MIDPADARPDARARRSRGNRKFFGGRATAEAGSIGDQPSRSSDGDDARRAAVRPLDQDADPDRRGGCDRGRRAGDHRERDGAAGARAEHRRGRRGRIDVGGRCDVPDAAADEEPRGAARRFPPLAGDRLYRSARRRRGNPAQRRGPHGDLPSARPARLRTFPPNSSRRSRSCRSSRRAIRWPWRPSRSAAKHWSHYVQLVLTGRTAFAQNLRGGIISHHVWRFADLATRLEFLLAGFGWCNMPWHMIEAHVAAGRLKRLVIAEEQPDSISALRRFGTRPQVRARRKMARGRPARTAEDLPDRPLRAKATSHRATRRKQPASVTSSDAARRTSEPRPQGGRGPTAVTSSRAP